MSDKTWKKPDWLKQKYVTLLNNTGGWMTPEDVMNCDDPSCNVIVNAPKALLCVAVRSQIQYLIALHDAGLLK